LLDPCQTHLNRRVSIWGRESWPGCSVFSFLKAVTLKNKISWRKKKVSLISFSLNDPCNERVLVLWLCPFSTVISFWLRRGKSV
jgi:hypothetical protein